jgi:hypothetical protein
MIPDETCLEKVDTRRSDHCDAISLTSSGSESSHALSPTAVRALRNEGGTSIITPTIVVLRSPGAPMGAQVTA